MAKSKYAPALFEKLQQKSEPRHRTGLALPRWWKNLGRGGASAQTAKPDKGAAPSAPPLELESDRPHASAVAPSVSAPLFEPAQPVSDGVGIESEPELMRAAEAPAAGLDNVSAVVRSVGPLVRYAEGRFQVSLNPVGAVILMGGLLLALFVSYQLGKHAAPSDAQVAVVPATPGLEPGMDVNAVRRRDAGLSAHAEPRGSETPPVPVRSTPLTLEPKPVPALPSAVNKAEITLPEAPAVVASARVPGLNYIVVERFQIRPPVVKTMEEAKEQAEKAQKWLAERYQLETTIYPTSNRKGYELWTVQGFKHPEQTPQREELADKIRAYGKLYAKEGHYLFGCEPRKF